MATQKEMSYSKEGSYRFGFKHATTKWVDKMLKVMLKFSSD